MKRICLNCKKKLIKDGSIKFCSRKCYGQYRSKYYVGEKSSAWKGGITKNLSLYHFFRRHKIQKQDEAYHKLNGALKRGKIEKEKCFFCNNPKTESHHYDYSKPLDVIWICTKCHGKLHILLRLHGIDSINKHVA